MKTFKEFLSEDDAPILLEKLIAQKCMPYLEKSEHRGLLYRGINSIGSVTGSVMVDDVKMHYYMMTVRKDRIPLTMPAKMSGIIDDYFEDKFGFRARSQAVFAFGHRGHGTAKGYGNKTCVIFPVGDFRYVWSEEVKDLYDWVEGKENKNETAFTVGETSEIDPKKVTDWISTLKYTDKDFDLACALDHEIMIECDHYIALPYGAVGNLRKIKGVLDITEA